jgi:hypothetical protein
MLRLLVLHLVVSVVFVVLHSTIDKLQLSGTSSIRQVGT